MQRPIIGTTLLVCFDGVIENGANEVITIDWLTGRNASRIPLNLRELAVDSERTCNQPPGWHFACNCLTEQFLSLRTVQTATEMSTSKYRTYDVSFHDVTSSNDILQNEECLPFQNNYVTILVVDNIAPEDELAVTLTARVRHSSSQHNINIMPGK